MIIAESKLSPSENKQGKNVELDIFHIDQIPNAMDKMGWKVSAQLMRHWFSIYPAFGFDNANKNTFTTGDARFIPDIRVNKAIVKMAWVKKHIPNKIDELRLIWPSAAGINRLKKKLSESGYHGLNYTVIGNSNDPQILDLYRPSKCYFSRRVI